ncbi:MAG: type II secretion system F family protein [Candidatus Omnitrophica bacterium]|nr:type II secretion system F family protein [Candidatus Omnitrophota bacterium]
MSKLLILLFLSGAVVLILSQLFPLLWAKFGKPFEKKATEAEKDLDNIFVHVEKKNLLYAYLFAPIAVGAVAFILLNNVIFIFLGLVVGFSLPTMVIKIMQAKRRADFEAQLLDAIQVMISSLKGGLSFQQAIEVMVEELPAPMSQEFGLVLKETKMGITLEQSLKHLSERMKMSDLNLLVNAISVAKETGGDLTRVLHRLSLTIRDNRKLKESVSTLTLQGRIQGVIMSILPFIFTGSVLSFNREHFDIMLKSDTGKILLGVAVVLQMVGVLLIHRFSKVEI